DAVLERLAKRFEDVAPELGELVEEEDAAMRERELARTRIAAAPRQRGRGRAVMRRAERSPREESRAGGQAPRDAPDARHLERFLARERRQDAGEPPREHRLAGAWRAGEEEVVSARRGELESAAGEELAAHVPEVELERGGGG